MSQYDEELSKFTVLGNIFTKLSDKIMNDPTYAEGLLTNEELLTTVLNDHELKVLIEVMEYFEVYIEVFISTMLLFFILAVLCLRRTFGAR